MRKVHASRAGAQRLHIRWHPVINPGPYWLVIVLYPVVRRTRMRARRSSSGDDVLPGRSVPPGRPRDRSRPTGSAASIDHL